MENPHHLTVYKKFYCKWNDSFKASLVLKTASIKIWNKLVIAWNDPLKQIFMVSWREMLVDHKYNLTPKEFEVLFKLSTHENAAIQKSDRGNSIILIDKAVYTNGV